MKKIKKNRQIIFGIKKLFTMKKNYLVLILLSLNFLSIFYGCENAVDNNQSTFSSEKKWNEMIIKTQSLNWESLQNNNRKIFKSISDDRIEIIIIENEFEKKFIFTPEEKIFTLSSFDGIVNQKKIEENAILAFDNIVELFELELNDNKLYLN